MATYGFPVKTISHAQKAPFVSASDLLGGVIYLRSSFSAARNVCSLMMA